ncbi:MAG TPA: PaaX family transcriptional regulator C-terminal domain-containing protein, partial [bacterium]|nr:PaaX family transcriptional regulator C-terminal domain-containing protein [bacterium]
ARRLRQHTSSDAACFAEKILLVHEYRKFLFVDPGLPQALLPSDWPGWDAARVFRDVYQTLEAPAARFFADAFEPPPGSRWRARAYFPLKTGGRFSKKALTPSTASALANTRNNASRS